MSCDKTIHAANVISRTHKRLPVCELCKRSAAAVYCCEDQAALCSGCDKEVHLANPLPHNTQPVESAMASGVYSMPELPAASDAKAAAPDALTAPAEDETSACGEHCLAIPFGSSSEGNTSLAVVPEMSARGPVGAPMPTTSGGNKDLKGLWGKDFDALEFEAAWLGNLDVGLDFSDIFGNEVPSISDAPGMVPSFHDVPAMPAVPHPKPAAPIVLDLGDMPSASDILEPLLDDDFVVPSFLPEDEEEVVGNHMLDSSNRDMKRAGDFDLPDAKRRSKPTTLPVLHLAPPPPPYTPQVPLPPAPVVEPISTRRENKSQAPVLNGANMTREQRVARYREKRKNRKFQKTIRYASRKAYAEVRPRIKGRFATREEVAAWKARKAAGIMNPEDDEMIFS